MKSRPNGIQRNFIELGDLLAAKTFDLEKNERRPLRFGHFGESYLQEFLDFAPLELLAGIGAPDGETFDFAPLELGRLLQHQSSNPGAPAVVPHLELGDHVKPTAQVLAVEP